MNGVLRHLLKGGGTCEERLQQPFLFLLNPRAAGEDGPAVPESPYDAPLPRAFAAVLRRKPQARNVGRTRVERGLERLRNDPRGLLGLTDEESEELRGWPFVEGLLSLSFEERYRAPGAMLRLALLAKTAAENLDPKDYEPEVIADHQARAWAELGNSYRVNDEFCEAEAAL